MNLNDLANIGQVIGALAVVVSLIYVAFDLMKRTPHPDAKPMDAFSIGRLAE